MKEPKIRFNEFKGEWKEVTLGEIAPLIGGYAFQSANFEKTGIPIVRISNILDSGIVGGDFAKYKCFEGDILFRLYDGDTVIAMSGATTGKVAVVKTQTFLYQNQRVGKFSRTDKIYYPFVSIFVSSKKFTKELNKKLTASAQPNASSKDIDSVRLSFPSSKDEQQKIASFFTTLDAQISASTSRLASLKQIKAASLQAMFPQEGETVPKLRFKGFEGEWEKVIIGKIGNCYSGLIGKTKEDFGIGNAYYITFLNVLTNAKIDTSILDAVNVRIGEHQNVVKKGDLLFNTSSETPEEVGMCSVMDEDIDNVYLNSFCFGLRITDENIEPTCIAYLMRSHVGRKIMSFLAQGATRYNLSKNNFCKVALLLPKTKAEQCAIASFFTNLDRQITLQSQRLEKLKQIKAACLDKMFV